MRKWSLARIWTVEEQEILRKYYRKERTAGIQKRMPYRTRSSIYGKAYRMGMQLDYDARSPLKRWSTREINILEKFYPREGTACSKRLKRSKSAVLTKAKMLGLQMQPPWLPNEDAVLLQYYPSEGINCYQHLSKKRSIQAVRHRARYLGLTAASPPLWSEEEMAILKNYPELEIDKLQTLLPDRTQSAIFKQRYNLEANGELIFSKQKPPWSEEEDAILRQYYSTLGGNCNKYLPNRKQSSIRQRAGFLGVPFEKPDWTLEEEAVLLKYYQSEGTRCYKRLPKNRTRVAIQHRAGLLGLTANRRPAWSEEEIDVFKKNPDLAINELQTLLPDRTKAAIFNQLKRLEANGELTLSKSKEPWSEEENAILRQYYPREGGHCQKYLPIRSRSAVTEQAKRLGIARDPSWTEEENEILKKHGHLKIDELRKHLPYISQKGIIKQMKHLEACGELTRPRRRK